jgi:hypothetical protein
MEKSASDWIGFVQKEVLCRACIISFFGVFLF